MADPWNSATAYGNGSIVSYNGLDYFRSNFPPTQTSGTPPNEEMSVDPKGDPIRTWTLWSLYAELYDPTRNRIIPRYFRLVDERPQETDPPTPLKEYQGMSDFQQSAYDNEFNDPYWFNVSFMSGYAVDMDQAGTLFLSTPADKCGVALQQYQEIGNIFTTPPNVGVGTQLLFRENLILVDGKWIQDFARRRPFKYYVFLIFNHPLYFRRVFQLAYRYRTNLDVEIDVTTNYTPTDNNYGRGQGTGFPNNGTETYFQPDNAVWQFQLPTAGDTLVHIWVKDIESND